MTMKRWDGDEQIDLTTVKRWTGTEFVTLTVAKRWTGTEFISIALPGGDVPPSGGVLSVSVNPGTATGSSMSTGPYPPFKTIASNSVTVASNGTLPLTYTWTRASGDSAVLVRNATSATTDFYGNVGQDQELQATYTCEVEDADGNTGSVNVLVTLIHTTDR